MVIVLFIVSNLHLFLVQFLPIIAQNAHVEHIPASAFAQDETALAAFKTNPAFS